MSNGQMIILRNSMLRVF